jgi:integrase
VPRPRTPVGTFGKIKAKELRSKTKDNPAVWEARTRFRMRNGQFARLRRRGHSEIAAINTLKKAASRLADEVAGKKISGDSRFAHATELWLASIEHKFKQGGLAAKTFYTYRSVARKHIIPRLGELTCREVEDDVGLCDDSLKAVTSSAGYAAAKKMRVVLSAICGYAVRNSAMGRNPMDSVETIATPEKKPIRALEPSERADFLAKLRAAVKARVDNTPNLGVRGKAWLDLPDIAEGGLATGGRIGELLALTGEDVDASRRLVELSHHLVRVEGAGIVRQPLRKGNRAELTVKVPSWSVPMLRRRKLESGGGPLFATWNGQWPDVGNVITRLGAMCEEIGYGWVTSHVFRKTVASHLGDNDITNEAIGDQLGNTPEVVEGHYRRKRVANEKVAHVLESMFDEPEPDESDEDGQEEHGGRTVVQ